MPYIADKKLRKDINRTLSYLPDIYINNPGVLNYILTKICHQYIQKKGLRYSTINEVIGVLECAKQELYHMIAAPYENKKRLENGGISELDEKTLEDVR